MNLKDYQEGMEAEKNKKNEQKELTGNGCFLITCAWIIFMIALALYIVSILKGG